MCTTPRQLLPSVFAGVVYPRGLRRTLKLPTPLAAAVNDTAKLMHFASAIGFGGKTHSLHWGFTQSLCVNSCTGVNVCICAHCCRPELVKNSHTSELLLRDMLQQFLHCYAPLQKARPSVILPMKVNRLCAWTRSKFLMLPLPLHIAGVQYHCHQLCAAYSSVSAVCQTSTINTVDFFSNDPKTWSCDARKEDWNIEYVDFPESWMIIPYQVYGTVRREMTSSPYVNKIRSYLRAVCHVFVRIVSVTTREDDTSVHLCIAPEKWRRGKLTQIQTYAAHFSFFTHEP